MFNDLIATESHYGHAEEETEAEVASSAAAHSAQLQGSSWRHEQAQADGQGPAGVAGQEGAGRAHVPAVPVAEGTGNQNGKCL